MNPYDFVRFPKRPAARESIAARGHDRFVGLSGTLRCRLRAEMPLFVPAAQDVPTRRGEHGELHFFHAGATPAIPGASLKGVIRTVVEATSGSCFLFDRLSYPERVRGVRVVTSYVLPSGYRHCTSPDKLCPACRLFGFLKGGQAFGGLVTLGDALAVPGFSTRTLTLDVEMSPKPRHTAFYRKPGTAAEAQGWKFYVHHPRDDSRPDYGVKTRTQRDGYNKTVDAAVPNASFIFDVAYRNLTEEELGLLVFSLILEADLRHKVGMGKPLGLGSARITVIGWDQLDLASRYRDPHAAGVVHLEGDAAHNAAGDFIMAHHRLLRSDAVGDLRRIWRWPASPADPVAYPSQAWFRGNPTAPISKAP